MPFKIKYDWQIICLIFLVVLFFFVYSFLSINYLKTGVNNQIIFNSPDETANYYFAWQFNQHSRLSFQDTANNIAQGLISPRSMRVINGLTVPASFIGLPLIAGFLAKFFGGQIIFFVVPLFAALAIFFFYLLVKELFNKHIALISSLLIAICPAWWYYATKSLMPNVLFFSFFIMAWYLFLTAIKRKIIWPYLLFGFTLALALMVRTSEITWLLPLFLFFTIINYKKVNWTGIILATIAFLIVFSPVFYFNLQNYHSLFSFGYAVDISLTGKDLLTQGLNIFEKIFLPFGFYPRAALNNFINYTFIISPFWSVLSLLSLITTAVWLVWKKERKGLVYLLSYLIVTFYLIIYYGSWKFNDNPDPTAITIGNSYIRYWLLIYVLSLPFIGYVIYGLFKKNRMALWLVTFFTFVVLSYVSLIEVYFGRDEGIYYVDQNLNGYQTIQTAVNKKIEDNAIIIADRLDKVFFPRHSVIFRLNNNEDYNRVYQLIEAGYPVYYFYFSRTPDQLQGFNQKYYQPYQLEVEPSILDLEEQSLYPVRLMIND